VKKHRFKFDGLIAAVLVLFVALTAGNAYIAQSSTRAAAPATGGTAAEPAPAGTAAPTGAPTGAATPVVPETRETTLVVYFSYEGSTEQLAQTVYEQVGGDLYEIVPETPYSEDFDETADFALEEQNNGVFPPVGSEPINTDQYDTIFLGHPNWWGEQPMVVQTFMREHDLNGKTIIPFISHDGSRFGNSLEVLETAYPDATILEGYAVRGDEVRADLDQVRQDIDAWLTGLGF
jgi:flavodoxin